MFRVSFLSVPLVALAASSWSAWAGAQTPPPLPPSPDGEELEVPASATERATPSPTVPAPTTPESSAASREPAAPPTVAPALGAPVSPAATAASQPPSTNSTGLPATAEPNPSRAGLRIGGYLQGQYQHSDLSEDQLQQGGAPLNQTRFLLRRARLRLDRTWDYAAGSLELDANTVRGPRVGIRRAEASVFYRGTNAENVPPLIALSVGVLDIPFGYELAENTRTRWFMERSFGSLALFPTDPDAGAKVWGAVSFLRYAVALMNGEPLDDTGFPRDPNANKDVLGRFGAAGTLGSQVELSGGTSVAVGKGFHRGQDAGKASVVWSDINEDGAHQPSEFVGVPGSAATPSENFKRWAIGLDLSVSLQTKLGRSRLYGEAFVASNYDRGYAPSDPVSTRLDARQAGGHLAVTQELTPYGVVGFRAGVYDPNSDIIETRAGKTLPKTQTVKTLSPLVGLVLPQRARLLLQYDFIRDYQARDKLGVPSDANNDQWTLRLQVEL